MEGRLFVKAPGRICFFGDHQDYLELPVIAATIDRYIYMEAFPIAAAQLQIDFKDMSSVATIDLNEELNPLAGRDYFRSALRVLAREGIRIEKGYRIQVWGDIPIQAGLSSSSAMVVAWIRLLLLMAEVSLDQISDDTIAKWTYTAEVLEFNEPGGLMDQYTIALGGLLFLETSTATYKRLTATWDSVVVVDSGIEKNTLQMLSHLKTNALEALAMVQQKWPSFRLEEATALDYQQTVQILPQELHPYWFAAIHNHLITQQALEAFGSQPTDVPKIAHLMNAHQHILQNHLKNTPEAMQSMMQCAERNGAYGLKIIGSGGGGCFVALTHQKNENLLIEALKTHGVKDAFPVHIKPPVYG